MAKLTNEQIEFIAEKIYNYIVKANSLENQNKFMIVYESEDGMVDDQILEEVTRLKDLLIEYEDSDKFELAIKVKEKIIRLETKLFDRL